VVVIDDQGKQQVVSSRVASMIAKLLEVERLILIAGKGKVEFNFAGAKVSRSVTLCEV